MGEMRVVKRLRSYAEQARWFAAHLSRPTNEGDWEQVGWTVVHRSARPVFRMQSLAPGEAAAPLVVVLDGQGHRERVVFEVDPRDVRTTEDECYRGGA